ncbi:hypothetical protein JOE11_000588 [Robbsia andropogonis]
MSGLHSSFKLTTGAKNYYGQRRQERVLRLRSAQKTTCHTAISTTGQNRRFPSPRPAQRDASLSRAAPRRQPHNNDNAIMNFYSKFADVGGN